MPTTALSHAGLKEGLILWLLCKVESAALRVDGNRFAENRRAALLLVSDGALRFHVLLQSLIGFFLSLCQDCSYNCTKYQMIVV